MTGANLIPMTVQKQNVVTAVIADLLTPNAVWYINCIGVHQISPTPGHNSSTAVVSLVLQQDAGAVYIGHVTFMTLSHKILASFPSWSHHVPLLPTFTLPLRNPRRHSFFCKLCFNMSAV